MSRNVRATLVLTIPVLLMGAGCGGSESVGARTDSGSGAGGKPGLDLTVRKDAAADGIPDSAATAKDAGASSGNATTKLVQLTAEQRATFCDQYAAAQGGYGRSVMCDGEEETTDEDQATCVEAVPIVGLLCPDLTVGGMLACANATGTDLCKFYSVPECKPLRDCSP